MPNLEECSAKEENKKLIIIIRRRRRRIMSCHSASRNILKEKHSVTIIINALLA
jgi:hypothetical protein